MKRRDTIGFEHRAVIRDHREPAILLPQRERRALDDVDLELAGIELQHGGVGDPGIGFQPVAHGGGVEEQQRGAAVDAADREHFVLGQLLAAVDGDRGDAESGGIGERIAGVAQRRDEFLEVAALDDAEAGAAQQQQHGRGDAGAVRQIALDGSDQPVRRLALERRFGDGALPAPAARATSMTAPMAAAFRSVWGPGDLSDRARRPAPSIARARQMLCPQTLASSGTRDVSVMPGFGFGLKAEEATCSLDAVAEAEIRNSSRPGSQAPHAPPALTFGLPGKQRVNRGEAERDLIRLLSSLPRIRKVLPISEPGRPRFRPDRRQKSYLCVRFSASAIWPCRKSANSIPWALSAFG